MISTEGNSSEWPADRRMGVNASDCAPLSFKDDTFSIRRTDRVSDCFSTTISETDTFLPATGCAAVSTVHRMKNSNMTLFHIGTFRINKQGKYWLCSVPSNGWGGLRIFSFRTRRTRNCRTGNSRNLRPALFPNSSDGTIISGIRPPSLRRRTSLHSGCPETGGMASCRS